jgi:hypothetical protein
MFIPRIDLNGFYNPAGWGPQAIANGFPLAVWMIVVGVLMMRKPGKRDPAALQPGWEGEAR